MNQALEEKRSAAGNKKAEGLTNGSFTAELWDWVKSISFALLVVVIVNQFIFSQSMVDGYSMEPTLENGERLLVNRILYRFQAPQIGDVVIFKDPDPQNGRTEYLVKRVVAVAGDQVEIRAGELYVNGQPVEEKYTKTAIEDGDFGPYTVEDNHVFVLGDNRKRNASRDSRIFGEIAKSSIVGRAEWIIWPLNKFGGV
ncbi:signal peptidase I [Paenibacillus sp. J2TS4]|uniref:signal peptidase I n=1 Tax=Paenibacillus sp. J2TS4 TaxID=2807194 RepID=UPI001B239DAD|nr:signal peptidase I [Paenibacillus sp. J2TS4]GIP34738.1 signal peptidase I [Paenibacillus sp. J2TS4]